MQMKWKTRYIRYKKVTRRLRRFLILFISVCFLCGYLIFKSSVVQTFLGNQIGYALSDRTNANISVEGVDFRPFDTFVLKGLLVLDHHRDTLLFAKDFHIEIDDYDLDKRLVKLGLLELNEANLKIKKYKGEKITNLKYFLTRLIKKKNTKRKLWSIYVKYLGLEELKFSYDNGNKRHKDSGIDFKHLKLSDVNATFNNVAYQDGVLNLNTDVLSFKEKSGFELIGLEGDMIMDNKNLSFKNLELKTPSSDINGQIKMEYKNFKSFRHFITDVNLLGEFEETTIDGDDIAFFAPKITGINRTLKFRGDISGTIDDLKADQLFFSYGKNTKFEGNLTIKGLSDAKTAIIEAQVRDLVTYENDLKSIPLAPFGSGKTFKTPKWMLDMGKMVFQGEFSGIASDFEAFGLMQTKAGEIRADIFFKRDSNNVKSIKGKVKTNSFDLGKVLGKSSLGKVSVSGELDVLDDNKDFKLKFFGDIPRFEFRDYTYTNIKMDGEIRDRVFSGELMVKDPNLLLDFDGEIDFSDPKLQRYDFVAELKNANLNVINWIKRDSLAQVSGKVKIGLTGNNIEDVNGILRVDDIVWKENNKVYKLDSLQLVSIKEKNREMITLNSDFFTGKIEGNFNLKEIPPTVINVFSKEIPSIINYYPLSENHKGDNKFRLMFKVYDYKMIHELFTPNFNISNNTRFSGRFDDENQSYLVQFASDLIMFKNRKIQGLKVYSKNKSKKIILNAECKFVQLFDTVGLQNIKFKANIDSSILGYEIGYENNSAAVNKGSISGFVDLNDLNKIESNFEDAKFLYRNREWKLDRNNKITFEKDKITVDNFRLTSEGQFLFVDGKASPASRDFLKVKMKDFELGTFKYFWDRLKIDLVGDASGEILFRGVLGNPVFTSDLSVDRLRFNNQPFGKVSLSASFVPTERKINLELLVNNTSNRNKWKTLEITGGYYPFDDKKLDLYASLKQMKLKFLEKYFTGVFSGFGRGKSTGDLHITGNLKHPVLTGKVGVNQLNLKVDYLNVKYAINDQDVLFEKDKIIFKDFIVSHDKWYKSKGYLNGVVTHTGFKNFKYNINSFVLDNFFCLNTTSNENTTYFGQAFVNGIVNLKGDGVTNYIGGNVSTVAYKDNKNSGVSRLTMPLDQADELELSEFVSFVNLFDTIGVNKKKIDDLPNLAGLELDFNFKINREAVVGIVFDPTVGDEIKANGHGAVGMQINSDGKFRMYGDFEVDEGNYYFTLQRIIGRKFIVRPGSKMSWDGDPLDATINMRTYYTSRANLIDLVDTSDVLEVDVDDRRIQVNTDLILRGSLWKPIVDIGISLPNGTPEENNQIESYIIGEDEINRQAFSLLLSSKFIPPVGTQDFREDGINQGLQVLEGQLNNALSGIWDNVDLGVDYNTNSDDKLKDEIRLLAGFQYKKFTVRTDFDINSQVGDFEADFRITNSLKAKAYHKITRDETLNSAISSSSSTTFGLGASYQKSFNSFGELFRGKKILIPESEKK